MMGRGRNGAPKTTVPAFPDKSTTLERWAVTRSKKDNHLRDAALETKLTHLGRDSGEPSHAVNPPAQRASTMLVNRAEDLYKPGVPTYGIHGMGIHEDVKDALCALEGAEYCSLVESGLLACTLPIFTFVGSGDHILLPGNAYGPTRRYCERSLTRTGGELGFYNADTGADIKDLIQPNTRLIMIESPGSLTFEMPDIRAIVDAAKEHGVLTALDNSWSGGLYLNPLKLGVDISILATTKYATGHADSLSGAVLTRDPKLAAKLEEAAADLGLCLSSDDAYILLRGLRTMPLRLKHQGENALELAAWLQTQDLVEKVFHPALPDDKYHKLWERDFTGSSGLFAFSLAVDRPNADVDFLNALNLFGYGFSYGGFESLAIHCGPQLKRKDAPLPCKGPMIRLSVGMEHVEDLKSDLMRGFEAIS